MTASLAIKIKKPRDYRPWLSVASFESRSAPENDGLLHDTKAQHALQCMSITVQIADYNRLLHILFSQRAAMLMEK
jgi:hypothetical protein